MLSKLTATRIIARQALRATSSCAYSPPAPRIFIDNAFVAAEGNAELPVLAPHNDTEFATMYVRHAKYNKIIRVPIDETLTTSISQSKRVCG